MPNPPFPTFNSGVVSAIDGYAEADLLYSTVEVLDSGYGNSYSWNSYYDQDGVFHNFQEERFSVAFPMMTKSETVTLENFFTTMNGPYGYFTFTDDQGVTWPQCQFDQETLEPQYLGPDQFSVEFKILAVTQAPIPPRALPNPPPPPGPPIQSGVLTIWSSYINTSGITATAGIAAQAFSDNAPFGQFGVQTVVNTTTPYGIQSTTYNLSALNDIPRLNATRDFPVSVFISNSAGVVQDPVVGISILIYDCWLDVTYVGGAGARLHPTLSRMTDQTVVGFGFVTNPELAFDADTNPPTTAATVTRTSFDFFNFINAFEIYGFTI